MTNIKKYAVSHDPNLINSIKNQKMEDKKVLQKNKILFKKYKSDTASVIFSE